MLTPKNNAAYTRNAILNKVAQSFIKDRFDSINNLIAEVNTEYPCTRHTPFIEQINKYRCMAVLGYCPEDETDNEKSLKEYAKEALTREAPGKSKISVINMACAACMQQQYVVSNMCRGCLAQPCRVNCPKAAIDIIDGFAHIDQSKCVKCGKCYEVCPYHAIVKAVVPCEEACPVGALYKDEFGKEHIDHEKCISCGKCLHSCPFDAIVERSEMVDVLARIHDSDKKVIAMVAPAIIGQFSGTPENLVGALKKAGFDEVVEVAVGADITTRNEAAEFIERMEEGQKLMTTSCCPAYFRAAKIHIKEIEPFVSSTKTPMYYTAELVKKEFPDCVAVFLGPCLAKRVEAEDDPNVDYVLTFEEVNAMLNASEIKVEECEAQAFTLISSSAQGRRFPLSGGVAGAVASLVEGKIDIRAETIDGLSRDNIKLMKRYATKGSECNMLEVMCCEGGCIAGPGCVALPKKAARAVETYVAQGENLKDKD